VQWDTRYSSTSTWTVTNPDLESNVGKSPVPRQNFDLSSNQIHNERSNLALSNVKLASCFAF